MTIYLEADTTNGITVFDYADLTDDMEFIELDEFASLIGCLEDGEVIRTLVVNENDSIYQKLFDEYGIH